MRESGDRVFAEGLAQVLRAALVARRDAWCPSLTGFQGQSNQM